MKVNPILKKWTQNDPYSLDLDNPNDLRDILLEYDFGMASHNSSDPENPLLHAKGLHHRSASGASQYSIATTGSGQRSGSFVHPYQQTPRPFTPPFTATSSTDLFRINDLTGRLADEEIEPRNYHYQKSTSNSSIYYSQSLNQSSQSSFAPQPYFPNKISSSRLALVSSYPSFSSQTFSNDISSSSMKKPQSSASLFMDKGFRIRSRSEVISRGRAKSVQEARRRFVEKERVLEEKAAREEIKQLEKRQQKEAIRIERSNRRSSASLSSRSKRSKSDATYQETIESFSTISKDMDPNSPLFKLEGIPEPKRNTCPAKQKTYSAWAMFLMWFRMRLMHIRGRIYCKS